LNRLKTSHAYNDFDDPIQLDIGMGVYARLQGSSLKWLEQKVNLKSQKT
jgi:hypothetical protein